MIEMDISFNRPVNRSLATPSGWRTGVVAIGLVLAALLPTAALVASDTKVISSVEVQRLDGVTQIVLRGAEDPIYTAFMRENPRRLIIDLPDVIFDGVETPIAVGDGLVESITLGAFGDPKVSPTMARVSVSLQHEAEYELLPEGTELVVRLTAPDAAAREKSPALDVADDTPQAPMPKPAPATEPAMEGSAPEAKSQAESDGADEGEEAGDGEKAPVESDEPEKTEPAAETQPPAAPAADVEASRIVRVVPGSDHVEVLAEGPIDNVDSFTLSDPDRVVIDFWGARNAVWPDKFPSASGPISRVRLGEHADKVRLVLDLRSPLESHVVEPTARGVRIALHTARAMARTTDSVPAAAADEAENVPAEPESESKPEDAESEEAESEEAPSEPATEEPAADAAEKTGPAAPDDGESMPAPSRNGRHPEAAKTSTRDVKPADTHEAEEADRDQPAKTDEGAEPTMPTMEKGDARGHVDYTYDGPTQAVQSVHFESVEGMDRVVVNLSAPVNAQLVEPDPVTAIVELPGTRIAPDAERRVDTKDFGGPVEVFSAFKTPEMNGDHVRIVLKRHAGAKARLAWEGSVLKIEFPYDGEAWKAPAPQAAPWNAPAAAGVPQHDRSAELEPIPAAIDPFAAGQGYAGPASAAAIDILQEGGFNHEKAYQGRRISLDFKDADMGNILRLIAEVSDLNVIAGEEVSGKVTLRLVDVPWDQALDIILLTKGLGFVRIGNILRIAPVDVLQREEQARLQERRAKEKLEDLVVKLQPVNYASAAEVRAMVKRLLSSRGSVIVDKRTSTLIIKDIPSVIHEATALIKAIDTQTPQVLIEAKIVEATLDFSRALGARWGIGYNHQGGAGGNQDLRLGPNTNDVVPGFGTGKQATNFIVSNPVTSSIGTLTMGLLGLDDKVQLDLQLQAAETSSKGKVISSPRVVTLDNRTATIQQGVAIRFDASDGDSVSTSFVDAVLKLDVTPHITSDHSIIMKINVSRNAPQLNTIGDAVGISKNETSTEALVRDGQTMVLGGIYTVTKGSGTTKVPYLADVPILGALFRGNDIKDDRKELLIFVTPYVVQEVAPAS